VTSLELSERWWGLDEADESAERKRATVFAELSKEIAPGHEIYRQVARVEAFFEPSDDVIVRLVDGTFALVHPTWSGRLESESLPTTKRLGDAATASQRIAEWEMRW
jgi:hypothetical protein